MSRQTFHQIAKGMAASTGMNDMDFDNLWWDATYFPMAGPGIYPFFIRRPIGDNTQAQMAKATNAVPPTLTLRTGSISRPQWDTYYGVRTPFVNTAGNKSGIIMSQVQQYAFGTFHQIKIGYTGAGGGEVLLWPGGCTLKVNGSVTWVNTTWTTTAGANDAVTVLLVFEYGAGATCTMTFYESINGAAFTQVQQLVGLTYTNINHVTLDTPIDLGSIAGSSWGGVVWAATLGDVPLPANIVSRCQAISDSWYAGTPSLAGL